VLHLPIWGCDGRREQFVANADLKRPHFRAG
jgi:hypothetical protein